MTMHLSSAFALRRFGATSVAVFLLVASCAFAQNIDPFPQPIAATAGVIRVGLAEFATLPQVGGEAARMMLLVNEPGSRRLFVNDMRGPLYTVSYDGKTVTPYVDINAPQWGVKVQSQGRDSPRSSAELRSSPFSPSPLSLRPCRCCAEATLRQIKSQR